MVCRQLACLRCLDYGCFASLPGVIVTKHHRSQHDDDTSGHYKHTDQPKSCRAVFDSCCGRPAVQILRVARVAGELRRHVRKTGVDWTDCPYLAVHGCGRAPLVCVAAAIRSAARLTFEPAAVGVTFRVVVIHVILRVGRPAARNVLAANLPEPRDIRRKLRVDRNDFRGQNFSHFGSVPQSPRSKVSRSDTPPSQARSHHSYSSISAVTVAPLPRWQVSSSDG